MKRNVPCLIFVRMNAQLSTEGKGVTMKPTFQQLHFRFHCNSPIALSASLFLTMTFALGLCACNTTGTDEVSSALTTSIDWRDVEPFSPPGKGLWLGDGHISRVATNDQSSQFLPITTVNGFTQMIGDEVDEEVGLAFTVGPPLTHLHPNASYGGCFVAPGHGIRLDGHAAYIINNNHEVRKWTFPEGYDLTGSRFVVRSLRPSFFADIEWHFSMFDPQGIELQKTVIKWDYPFETGSGWCLVDQVGVAFEKIQVHAAEYVSPLLPRGRLHSQTTEFNDHLEDEEEIFAFVDNIPNGPDMEISVMLFGDMGGRAAIDSPLRTEVILVDSKGQPIVYNGGYLLREWVIAPSKSCGQGVVHEFALSNEETQFIMNTTGGSFGIKVVAREGGGDCPRNLIGLRVLAG